MLKYSNSSRRSAARPPLSGGASINILNLIPTTTTCCLNEYSFTRLGFRCRCLVDIVMNSLLLKHMKIHFNLRLPRTISNNFVRRCYSSKILRISPEIQEAVRDNKPVIALETTIYTHGFPFPDNVDLASHLESVVRLNGGIPATIGILHGVARVGLTTQELTELASAAGKKETMKVSRRDLPYITGLVSLPIHMQRSGKLRLNKELYRVYLVKGLMEELLLLEQWSLPIWQE